MIEKSFEDYLDKTSLKETRWLEIALKTNYILQKLTSHKSPVNNYFFPFPNKQFQSSLIL